MKKQLAKMLLLIICFASLSRCIISSSSYDYDEYILVKCTYDPNGLFYWKVLNNSEGVLNEYIEVVSNSNITLYRNGLFEKNSSTLMYFTVFEFDNITLEAGNLRFYFFIPEVVDVPVDQVDKSDLGDTQRAKWQGRFEIIIAIFIGAVIALIIRRRKLR